jgi:succinyl-CoA synthetase beta subunit
MARLHEHQSKKLLAEVGVATPRFGVAESPERARAIAAELGGSVAVKAQAWVTSRAGKGLIRFADSPETAADAARAILAMEAGQFPIEEVLVEEKRPFAREFYIGIIVDDASASPVAIISSRGGSGIEEIAREHPESVAKLTIDITRGLRDHEARNLARKVGLSGKTQSEVAGALVKLWNLARKWEARSAEINPLVELKDGSVMALDCRVAVDDYAAFRHPDLKIDFPRELGHPPTKLEKIAWEAEKNDYRGTFFFAQMGRGFSPQDGYVGFHGAGGGGSMMSMDAITAAGFKIANFTDTSGNPSAAKVYKAARIILAQPNIVGYFGSGSGVASQEQFHSAYGLAKAFWEVDLPIPAVVRLGGNSEDRAVDILRGMAKYVRGPVEGYKKDDTPAFCANRLRALVDAAPCPPPAMRYRSAPEAKEPYRFAIDAGGSVAIDHALCDEATTKVILEMCPNVLKANDAGKPVLAVSEDEARSGRFQGWIACEVECRLRANPAVWVDLPIMGLKELL